jgi:predicted Fe-S protein YdhL (DUF1289 family)
LIAAVRRLGDNARMDVPSPCIKVCVLGGDQVCLGCGRHIDEIAAWGSAAPALKLRIVAAARERLARIDPLLRSQAAAQ